MQVEHQKQSQRFVARTDAGEAELAYAPAGDAIDLQHTFVPPGARGAGVGEALVQRAFAYAREEGLGVIPTCPFVSAWLNDNPEQKELVAR